MKGPVNPLLRAKRNPLSQCQSGFQNAHALAVFFKRPQAENQIGAEGLLYAKSTGFYSVSSGPVFNGRFPPRNFRRGGNDPSSFTVLLNVMIGQGVLKA